MIVNVWLVYKADEPRVYTRTEEPSEAQRSAYKANGCQLFRAVVNLPVDLETPVLLTHAKREE